MAATSKKPPTYESIRDLGHTRQILLDAAARVFAEKGLAGTRIDDLVAASGGVNRSMIYYIFSSKHGLYREVLKHILERGREIMLPMLMQTGGDPRQGGGLLRTSVVTLHKIYADNPQWAKLLLRETLDGGEDLRWAIESIPDFHVSKQTAMALLEQARDRNLIRLENPHAFIVFIQVVPLILPVVKPILGMLFPPEADVDAQVSMESWQQLLEEMVARFVRQDPVQS